MDIEKIPDVKEALEEYFKMPHGFLEVKAKAKLKRMDFRILACEEAPEWIKKAGCPDIIAEKDGEYILVEVKPSDQLKKYSETKAKLILVIDVNKGEAIEVWEIKELENLDNEFKENN